jgi:NADH-quinone oxidoreductase subunit G
LQLTRDARPPAARMAPALMDRLGLAEGDRVRVAQDGGEAILPVQADASVPPGCVRIAAAHPLTAGLGDMFGTVTLERVAVAEKVPA